MPGVSDVDKNLKVATTIEKDDVVFLDVREEPFQVYGLHEYRTAPHFIRLPEEVAAAASEGVQMLNFCTAGGRVRFSTDSAYVAIQVKMPEISPMPHMPLTGTSGFDLYIDGELESEYYQTYIPPRFSGDGYEAIVEFYDRKPRQLTINFPLYNAVDNLYIGLQKDATVGAGKPYRYEKPVVYYGSSITQGACASRPGTCYQPILSRHLDTNYINLGFSGNCRAEDVMIEYISNLDMSVFVCDYDHNAPSKAHLRATHEKLFLAIREKHPELPVIFLTAPGYFENDPRYHCDVHYYDWSGRRDIIHQTYRNAKLRGDQNVYFIDGESLYHGLDRGECSVDNLHPNDLGFYRMAQVVEPVLRHALETTLK